MIRDGTGSGFKLNRTTSDILSTGDSWQCKWSVEEPSVTVTEESLTWWTDYVLSLVRTAPPSPPPDEEEEEGKEKWWTRVASLSAEIVSFILCLKPTQNAEIECGIAYTTVNTKALKAIEVGVETAWCRRLRQQDRKIQRVDSTGALKFIHNVHHWESLLYIGGCVLQYETGTSTRKLQVETEEIRLEFAREIFQDLIALWMCVAGKLTSTPKQEKLRKLKKLEKKPLLVQVAAVDLMLFLPVQNAGKKIKDD